VICTSVINSTEDFLRLGMRWALPQAASGARLKRNHQRDKLLGVADRMLMRLESENQTRDGVPAHARGKVAGSCTGD